jgi:5'-methylthioadenosine phosphorylase
MAIAIIGGTGFLQFDSGSRMTVRDIETPYGWAEALTTIVDDRHVVFMPRHGQHYRTPPHRINFRANIDALRRLGCEWVVATNAVGSLNPDMKPGDFVLPDQFLDFTKGRPSTFYDGGNEGVRFVDMTTPYCPMLQALINERMEVRGETAHLAGAYACTEGPRFETPAEIRMLKTLGADLVGMTGVPEVVLAREAGMCYASVCIVTNWAAGIADKPLTSDEVYDMMAARGPALQAALLEVVSRIDVEAGCNNCRAEEPKEAE